MIANTKNQSETIVAFGEVLWDCFPTGAVLGGAPANFAYRLHGLGLSPHVISRVGNDDFGKRALDELSLRGLDVSGIQVDEVAPTGTVAISLSPKGDASYVINPGVAYDRVELTPELMGLAERARFFYFGSLIQRESESRTTLYALLEAASNAQKILDLNLRKGCFSAETVIASLERADVLKLNHEEVPVVAQLVGLPGATAAQFARAVIERFNLAACLITRAEHGVYAMSSTGEVFEEEGYQVAVVDTVGSGDAFTAGFVARQLRGESFSESCRFGNYLGALVAEQKGAMSPLEPHDLTTCRLPLRPNGGDSHASLG